MDGPEAERWQDLCRQASTETDSTKLLKLVEEINRLLNVKADGLKSA
jgi:hypothetical protein